MTDNLDPKKPGSSLNPNAAPYQHKVLSQPNTKQTMNTNAKPFVPKANAQQIPSSIPQEIPQINPPPMAEYYGEPIPYDFYEFDPNHIYDDEGEYEEEDEDWIEECKDCPCCHGWIYNCSGEACKNMDKCYCKVKLDLESMINIPK